MRPSREILEPARRVGGAPFARALDQGEGGGSVPALAPQGRGKDQGGGEQQAPKHAAISRAVRTAATALLVVVAACGDITIPGGGTPTADLLPLGLDLDADPPPAATFWVSNARLTVRGLRHSDAFNTLYAELRFSPGILASLDGMPLGPNDSVQVTVTPRSNGYGITLGPSGLAFAIDATPTVTFAFARYGDAAVAEGSMYESVSAYAAALEVWEEVTPGRWSVARGSALQPGDQIGAALDAPGRLMVAAPR